MANPLQITACIVAYNNDFFVLKQAIKSFLSTHLNVKLFLIDNSLTSERSVLADDDRIIYQHYPSNVGFGAGHNIVLEKIMDQSPYHLVMNPDVKFENGTLEKIFMYMNQNEQVGSLMPKVIYEDGKIQRHCKLLPTPFNLICRRFFENSSWAKKENAKYELKDFNYNFILNTPSLCGCFMFIRTSILKKVGLFDSRYFLYLEDYDLNRRIHKFAETIFYPEVSIVHLHAHGSYKVRRLLKLHIQSAIQYFNKWGWLNDKERVVFNNNVLNEIIRKNGIYQ